MLGDGIPKYGSADGKDTDRYFAEQAEARKPAYLKKREKREAQMNQIKEEVAEIEKMIEEKKANGEDVSALEDILKQIAVVPNESFEVSEPDGEEEEKLAPVSRPIGRHPKAIPMEISQILNEYLE